MIKRIVVDSNIIFSSLLNIDSKIGQLIINGSTIYSFYAPDFIRDEILEHSDKIKQLSKITDREFIEIFELVLRRIKILSPSLIEKEFYLQAYELCKSIDPNDTDFIAVTEFVRGKLWTGDKKLIKGLRSKNYQRLITTEELYLDFKRK